MNPSVAETPRQTAERLTGRDYLSYSAISTYQACPLRYYFRYVLGLPERTVSASLMFGRAIHRAVEHHFNQLLMGSEPPSLEDLVAAYNREWQETDVPNVRFAKDDSLDTMYSLAQKALAAFQASSLAVPEGQIIGVEEELRGVVVPGCPELLGRVDLMIETADSLTITDLKTARSRWSREQVEQSAGQLLLYSELARELAPRKQVRLQFAVLTKTKAPALNLHAVEVDRRQVERTKRIVERVWTAIEREIFYPAPSPAQCCGCPFRTPCRAWAD